MLELELFWSNLVDEDLYRDVSALELGVQDGAQLPQCQTFGRCL